jgi:hypothetical protein
VETELNAFLASDEGDLRGISLVALRFEKKGRLPDDQGAGLGTDLV